MEWHYWCQPWGFKGLVTCFLFLVTRTLSPCPAFSSPQALQPPGFEVAAGYSNLDELKKRDLLRVPKKKPWLFAASRLLRRRVFVPPTWLPEVQSLLLTREKWGFWVWVVYSVVRTHLCLCSRIYRKQCSYCIPHPYPTRWSDMRAKIPRWLPAFAACIVWEVGRVSEGWAVTDSAGPWNHIPKLIDEARIRAGAGECVLVLQMFCHFLLVNRLHFCFFIFLNYVISFYPLSLWEYPRHGCKPSAEL